MSQKDFESFISGLEKELSSDDARRQQEFKEAAASTLFSKGEDIDFLWQKYRPQKSLNSGNVEPVKEPPLAAFRNETGNSGTTAKEFIQKLLDKLSGNFGSPKFTSAYKVSALAMAVAMAVTACSKFSDDDLDRRFGHLERENRGISNGLSTLERSLSESNIAALEDEIQKLRKQLKQTGKEKDKLADQLSNVEMAKQRKAEYLAKKNETLKSVKAAVDETFGEDFRNAFLRDILSDFISEILIYNNSQDNIYYRGSENDEASIFESIRNSLSSFTASRLGDGATVFELVKDLKELGSIEGIEILIDKSFSLLKSKKLTGEQKNKLRRFFAIIASNLDDAIKAYEEVGGSETILKHDEWYDAHTNIDIDSDKIECNNGEEGICKTFTPEQDKLHVKYKMGEFNRGVRGILLRMFARAEKFLGFKAEDFKRIQRKMYEMLGFKDIEAPVEVQDSTPKEN